MDQFVHNDLHVDLPFILRPIASYGLQLDLFTNNMFCNFKDQLTFGIIKLLYIDLGKECCRNKRHD